MITTEAPLEFYTSPREITIGSVVFDRDAEMVAVVRDVRGLMVDLERPTGLTWDVAYGRLPPRHGTRGATAPGSGEAPAGPKAGHDVSCTKCVALERELEAAERAGDQTKAVDCRVLLRRHPQHDGVPVEAGRAFPDGGGRSEPPGPASREGI
ncbi:hypothetical protein AB0B07_00265 [Streptomyces sioyaensis]|uniref:hypothetical protein n=1 Tax=Streptomyces sioyaensis TaxID=67364 RepID=UPI0033DEDD3A